MSMLYSIQETCGCGAKFIYEERVIETYHSNQAREHMRFLDAHKDCRTKAIISNNKELRMFLVNKTSAIEKASEL